MLLLALPPESKTEAGEKNILIISIITYIAVISIYKLYALKIFQSVVAFMSSYDTERVFSNSCQLLCKTIWLINIVSSGHV